MPETEPNQLGLQDTQESMPAQVHEYPRDVQDTSIVIPLTLEHGVDNHVCDASCKHTQESADAFADSLFANLPEVSESETGHVHDAHCQHSEVEAGSFAERLFANAERAGEHEHTRDHNEKKHVGTAECTHRHKEANHFAEDSFEDARLHKSHSETGHVCDAHCQHSQAEADRFAESLFMERIEPGPITEVREEMYIENASRPSAIDAERLAVQRQLERLQQQAVLAEEDNPAATLDKVMLNVEVETETDMLGDSVDAEPAKIKVAVDKKSVAAIQVEAVTKNDVLNTAPFISGIAPITENTSWADVVQLPQQLAAIVYDELPSGFTEQGGTVVDELPEALPIENIELFAEPAEPAEPSRPIGEVQHYVALEDTDDIRLPHVAIDSELKIENATNHTRNSAGETEVYLSSQFEAVIEADNTEQIALLEEYPELEPIASVMPSAVEQLTPQSEHEHQEVIQALEQVIAAISCESGRSGSPSEVNVMLEEVLEKLTIFLNIEPKELETLLKMNTVDGSLDSETLQMLVGLKKLLGIEISYKFKGRHASNGNNDAISNVVRLLGKIIVSFAHHGKGMRLASAA